MTRIERDGVVGDGRFAEGRLRAGCCRVAGVHDRTIGDEAVRLIAQGEAGIHTAHRGAARLGLSRQTQNAGNADNVDHFHYRIGRDGNALLGRLKRRQSHAAERGTGGISIDLSCADKRVGGVVDGVKVYAAGYRKLRLPTGRVFAATGTGADIGRSELAVRTQVGGGIRHQTADCIDYAAQARDLGVDVFKKLGRTVAGGRQVEGVADAL